MGRTTAQRILIVEDNEDSALSLKLLLEAMGYAVGVVHDGEGAVAAASSERPDVILMDVGLPRMNGYDAARQIRRECRDRKILIIALTGWGKESDRRQSADAGIDHHLVKPLDLGQLRELLEPGSPSVAA